MPKRRGGDQSKPRFFTLLFALRERESESNDEQTLTQEREKENRGLSTDYKPRPRAPYFPCTKMGRKKAKRQLEKHRKKTERGSRGRADELM